MIVWQMIFLSPKLKNTNIMLGSKMQRNYFVKASIYRSRQLFIYSTVQCNYTNNVFHFTKHLPFNSMGGRG